MRSLVTGTAAFFNQESLRKDWGVVHVPEGISQPIQHMSDRRIQFAFSFSTGEDMNHSNVRRCATESGMVLNVLDTRLGIIKWLMVLSLFLVFAWSNGVASAASSVDEQVLKAADCGDLAQVRSLLRDGANPNAKDATGNTLLMYAAGSGKLDLVKFLIDRGADVHAKRPDGQTVLLHAAGAGNTEVLRLLVKMGLDVNSKTTGGETALMMASMGGSLEEVQFLLENKAELNAQNSEGHTALWYTNMLLKGKDVARYLRSIGAK